MRVHLDTSPLTSGHAGRGIGTYTRELLQGLRDLAQRREDLIITSSQDEEGTTTVPDVVHYPFFDLFFATLPWKRTAPTVVTIHDVIPLVFPEQYPPGIKGKLRFLRQKKALQKVDAVITDSECSKQDIVRLLQYPEEKIHVVPLAASPALKPLNEYFAEKFTQPFELPAKYVVYVGDINYNKNIPTLLLALTQLPEDLHLVVVSRTFNNTAIPEGKRIHEIIEANNLQERVHVVDVPTDRPELLAGVLTEAKCLVHPSLYEGFGLTVLEALQVGTVVVSSNASSLPKVTGDAAIMVEPTIIGLVEGIEQAVRLRGDDREAWIARGQKWAKQFSWNKTAEQTLAVYEGVVKQSAV